MKHLNAITKISFIGSGNVASHLAGAFISSGLEVTEVYSPNNEHAQKFAKKYSCGIATTLKALNTSTELYIIAVPDTKVEAVAKELPGVEGIVVHTSGITSMNTISNEKYFGVFYPLQTFTLGRELDISDSPVCIEASDENVLKLLKELASKISNSVHEINSEQRRLLHLAAVMVNNFTNHLYYSAEQFLNENELDLDLLRPLILETARKVQDISPADSQTGPAKRNDLSTIQKHMEMLNENTEFQKLYQLMTDQILKKYHE